MSIQELSQYFKDKPLNVSGDEALGELWMHFVHEYLNEKNLATLAGHLNMPSGEIDAADYDRLPRSAKEYFYNWMEQRGDVRCLQHERPEECPSWMFITPERVLPDTTWLIHFTDHAEAVVRDGFTRGVGDFDRLAITFEHSVFGAATRINQSNEAGYNFAFLLDGSEGIEGRALQASRGEYYGKQGVIFQAEGLLVDHHNDGEKQVIFWGPDARNAQSLERVGESWNLNNGTKIVTSLEELTAYLRPEEIASPVRRGRGR